MEFDLPRAAGLLLGIVAVGTVGLIGSGVMPTRIVLMMVLPSMLIFAAVAFAIGAKHGAYRATN